MRIIPYIKIFFFAAWTAVIIVGTNYYTYNSLKFALLDMPTDTVLCSNKGFKLRTYAAGSTIKLKLICPVGASYGMEYPTNPEIKWQVDSVDIQMNGGN